MKRIFTLFLGLVCLSQFSNSAPFTAGNIVVVRVGTGSGTLNSNAAAVFLDEYTVSGSLVQTIPLPTSVIGSNYRLTISGSATSEGFINLSSNRSYLTIAGYDADPGTANVNSTTGINRVVGVIDANGVVNTTTGLTDAYTGNNIRSAVTTNGIDIWTTGTGSPTSSAGVRYTVLGSSSSAQLSSAPTNTRVVSIFNGQLYVSSGSSPFIGTSIVGNGTPTTSGQTTTLIASSANNTSPYSFVFFDANPNINGVDVLYVADDNSTNGGIYKYSLVGSTWIANGRITGAARSVTGTINNGIVTLAITSAAGNTLSLLTDNSGYNTTITGTVTSIVTATTNTVFRGVALTPGTIILPLQLLSFSASPLNNALQFSWKTATEQRTSHFEIEQSTDGRNFTSIANVAAAGNSSTQRSYAFTGTLPTVITYYRLKMVDADGKFTTSSVVKIAPAKNGFALGNVYPVPAKNTLTVEWTSSRSGNATLQLTDLSGRTLRTLSVNAATGFNQKVLDVQGLAAGQYLLQVTTESGRQQTLITKQ
jgi:hypothetical protein